LSTWQAFWRTAVDGAGRKEVAAELGLTVAAVYLAKSRVIAAPREQIRLAEEADVDHGGPPRDGQPGS
jgi:hypothetical protein